MTSNRPYREAMSKEAAYEELIRESGRQFDPEVVEAFLSTLQSGSISVEYEELNVKES